MTCRWWFPAVVSVLVVCALPALTAVVEKRSTLTEMFISGLEIFQKEGIQTSHFKEALHHLALPPLPRKLENFDMKSLLGSCESCEAVVSSFVHYYKNGRTAEQLAELMIYACISLNVQTEEVCTGYVDSHIDILVYIIDNTPDLTVEQVCGVAMQTMNCSGNNLVFDWTVDVDLGEKPQGGSTEEDTNSLTILQLSDMHYEPLYLVGSNAACDEPVCCRSSQGGAQDPEDAAGYWGDYRVCDTPGYSIQDAIDEILMEHNDLDYIYFTGDVIDHAMWDTSREKNSATLNTIFSKLKEAFGDIPIYPAIGNHESHPYDQFAPNDVTNDSLSTTWLYETVADLWRLWLPEDTKETILQGGFYTTLLKPGLRLIVINNNVCYTPNWWLLHNPVDPYNQLKWLAETLLAAEAAGEKVHILAHIPSGESDCSFTWAREYNKIINRFEYTIAAQFNGHTHKDHFTLHYAYEDTSRPSAVAFNGGGLTTFVNINPNYRIYQVGDTTGAVLDASTWIYNLSDANISPDITPRWYKLYSFLEAYGLDSMNLTELNKLVHQMAQNTDLIQQYYKFYVLNADPSLEEGCDVDCMKEQLCSIVTSYYPDSSHCDDLTANFGTTEDENESSSAAQFKPTAYLHLCISSWLCYRMLSLLGFQSALD